MIETDALVIGAGPVGLFQVFQLGLLGLKAELIDVLPEPGGQCHALYPDKPIYDVPGIPVCTGRELTQLLLAQAKPFMPTDARAAWPRNLHLGHLVAELQALPEGGFLAATDQGLRVRAKAVFIAAGAGAFVPRKLAVAGLDGACNVHYHVHEPSTGGPPPWVGEDVVIAGGGEEALTAAIALLEIADDSLRPASVRLLHRRDQFQADDALLARTHALLDSGQLGLVVGMPSSADVRDGRLHALQLTGPDSQTRELPIGHLIVRLGMSPKLGPLADWGMALERKQVSVSTDSFVSSVPGIHAVGDINHYPGKKRLLLCGFHEATLAAHHAAATLQPDAPQHLLYTTTSPLLHQRLGVS